MGLLFGFAFQATAVAHLLDEYVQAAKITLIPTGVGIELRLSPGVELADRIFATIDGDRNGQISTTEEQAYAQRVVQDLTLEVNDRAVPLILTSVQFPSRHEMNEGIGAIRQPDPVSVPVPGSQVGRSMRVASTASLASASRCTRSCITLMPTGRPTSRRWEALRARGVFA